MFLSPSSLSLSLCLPLAISLCHSLSFSASSMSLSISSLSLCLALTISPLSRSPSSLPPQYQSLWEAVENEDTVAVQSLLSRERSSAGGAAGGKAGGVGSRGGSLWERGGGGEKREKDWEREREKGVNRVSEQGLVPLDVAALTHNSPLLQVLAKAGARHNPVREFVL